MTVQISCLYSSVANASELGKGLCRTCKWKST